MSVRVAASFSPDESSTVVQASFWRSAKKTKDEKLRLSCTGYQTYEGTFNDRKIRIQRDDQVAHGSFPANKRQKRERNWSIKIDGKKVGDAPTLSKARALAVKEAKKKKKEPKEEPQEARADFEKIAPESLSGVSPLQPPIPSEHPRPPAPPPRTASVVKLEGGEGAIRLEDVRRGDRVRLLKDLEEGKLRAERDALVDVVSVQPTDPSLVVMATVQNGKAVTQQTMKVRPEDVAIVVNSDDPRVA